MKHTTAFTRSGAGFEGQRLGAPDKQPDSTPAAVDLLKQPVDNRQPNVLSKVRRRFQSTSATPAAQSSAASDDSPSQSVAVSSSEPTKLRAEMGVRSMLRLQPGKHELLVKQFRQLEFELRTMIQFRPTIAVLNAKSAGKTTISSWLTCVLQHFMGLTWLLADLNENGGGPVRRVGIDANNTLALQYLIRHIEAGGIVNYEFLVKNLATHWQPSLGVSAWNDAHSRHGYSDAFMAMACDPLDKEDFDIDQVIRTLSVLITAVYGIVADTGNGYRSAYNNGSFRAANGVIYCCRADETETWDQLTFTLDHYRGIDREKVDGGTLVVNVSRGDYDASFFGSLFGFPEERVIFVPENEYLRNGHGSKNGNIVRLDKLPLELLVPFMQIGHSTMQQVRARSIEAALTDTSSIPQITEATDPAPSNPPGAPALRSM